MDVILVSSRRGLGKVGDVVKVKDGYARNYLLPNGFAVYATQENKDKLTAMREKLDAENHKAWEIAKKLVEEIQGKMISIVRQVGNNNKLFGSVLARDISASLSNMGHKIAKDFILIRKPIKFSGVHPVEINLHYDVSTVVYVSVAHSENETRELYDNFIKSSASSNQ
ncbi:50S ribosomal protein L9 [Candidatus Xenohaliotis californiensis]|uniref:Large ribosomal subunit protein bL9 n=1 Tax=Candidatus Xenohaliotis californiensis TaxID=84677 RepID=A0ABM9N801_9RICK|nr:50S ribosomal protein L9 [Candidatus Xenohaliotis californiensis]